MYEPSRLFFECLIHRIGVPSVSFQIYDFDGDNYISVSDLTAVVAATLREHKIFILRSDIDQIVQSTMIEASPKHANMISFDE